MQIIFSFSYLSNEDLHLLKSNLSAKYNNTTISRLNYSYVSKFIIDSASLTMEYSKKEFFKLGKFLSFNFILTSNYYSFKQLYDFSASITHDLNEILQSEDCLNNIGFYYNGNFYPIGFYDELITYNVNDITKEYILNLKYYYLVNIYFNIYKLALNYFYKYSMMSYYNKLNFIHYYVYI